MFACVYRVSAQHSESLLPGLSVLPQVNNRVLGFDTLELVFEFEVGLSDLFILF